MGFVYGFNDGSDSVFVVWILGKVSIEKANSNLIFLFSQPEVYKVMNLLAIHELHVVYMSILLCSNSNTLRITV